MRIEISIEEAEFIIEQYLKLSGCDLLHDFSENNGTPQFVTFKNDGQEDGDYQFVAYTAIPWGK